MAEQEEPIRVNIFGTEYPIRGDADPTFIEEIAQYVDEKMREVSKQMSVPSMSKVAILAAMNIAEELLRERSEREKIVSELEERAAELSGLLEKELMENAS
jgi:cell division protein ZapA